MSLDDLLTTSQVAWMLHVSTVTVRKYCKKGLLTYSRAWPQAPYLISRKSVEELQKSRRHVNYT